MPFHDLNLPIDTDVPPTVHRDRLSSLLCNGYDVAASSVVLEGRITEQDRCTLQPVDPSLLIASGPEVSQRLAWKAADPFTSAPQPSGSIGAASASGSGSSSAGAVAAVAGCLLRQLSRLTFVASDPVQAQALAAAGSVTRSYDVVAVVPRTERVLVQACSSLDVDLISLELGQRLPFKLRPQALRPALARGVHFEICYATALRDPASRRQFFSNAQALVRALNGKGIVLSSGARTAHELRGPTREVGSIAALLGLTAVQAKDAVGKNAAATVAHGAARRRQASKGVFVVLATETTGQAPGAAAAGAAGLGQTGGQLQQQQQQGVGAKRKR